MAKQVINLGTAPTGAGGDDRRSAWQKAIANFDELYAALVGVFNKSNIVGAVSQSAGVPTGAVIQRGSNANGAFVRYADGTQICWTESAFIVPPIGNSSVTWTFPIAFASRPGFVSLVPDIGLGSDARTYAAHSQYSGISASNCKFVTYMASTVGCGAFATGRWF